MPLSIFMCIKNASIKKRKNETETGIQKKAPQKK